jgi:hypothetical protein
MHQHLNKKLKYHQQIINLILKNTHTNSIPFLDSRRTHQCRKRIPTFRHTSHTHRHQLTTLYHHHQFSRRNHSTHSHKHSKIIRT